MIVLDTHVLIWWVNGDNPLSSQAKAVIEQEYQNEEGVILVSAISAWEIARLVDRDRLTLAMNLDDWIDTVKEINGFGLFPSMKRSASSQPGCRGRSIKIRPTAGATLTGLSAVEPGRPTHQR